VVTPFVESGKLKVLAISGSKRARSLPNVPTFAEAGHPTMEASFYYGLIAPAGLPDAIKEKIASDVRKVVMDVQFKKENLDSFALDAVADSPKEFEKFLVQDREMAASKVKLSGARLD
jgi:tripartite-type tricarboxylate transporter receptor subunit TctC